MIELNFENILEKVVNNRTISRKEKQLAINRFLKMYPEKGNNFTEAELEVLKTVKQFRKTYIEMNKNDKK